MSKTKLKQSGFKYVDDFNHLEWAENRAKTYQDRGYEVKIRENRTTMGKTWYSLYIRKEN
jgi:hypothetical protein